MLTKAQVKSFPEMIVQMYVLPVTCDTTGCGEATTHHYLKEKAEEKILPPY